MSFNKNYFIYIKTAASIVNRLITFKNILQISEILHRFII